MRREISALAGNPAPADMLIDVARLLAAYVDLKPDPAVTAQRVTFGTSGHRGTSFDRSFNEGHVLAITQAICDYRRRSGIGGPLFIGFDTHALSRPAFDTALEVLSANGVETRIAAGNEFTPTPVISHAILGYNRGRHRGLADGIVITPSHNPPDFGGFKYNPPTGGPASSTVTSWIEERANVILEGGVRDVRRLPLARALRASTTRMHDYLSHFVDDLCNVIDVGLIRSAAIRIGVDPLGGAGVHYWPRIAERYGLDLTVVNDTVDPQFAFMTVDWDGRIRMDPSSSYAMQRLIGLRDTYDIAFACDTDHDRHGIVTRSAGLLPANHFLSVAIDDLFRNRPRWSPSAAVGKTVVSSAMIDRVAKRLGRVLFDVPVGFKWFADGLGDGSLGFGGEESAGATFLRRDGRVWTTDKDGIAAALLSAEMTARQRGDPGERYRAVCADLGEMFADRVEATITPDLKAKLTQLTATQIEQKELAGEAITEVIDAAPGNSQPIGGFKVVSTAGWFAARPSGTEAMYRIYAESFRSTEHLQSILDDAQHIVDGALAGP